ncbi:hypothetical protein EF405_12345 [Cyclobacteriaceae bacterium YHN15]|nr:hypothetical protein EF405_12345 [Cyclobacteriaceae bacterium YHN15]
MRKKHAIHNEEACDYLLASNKFNDWVVTTAFYSALHFVQHEIFPISEIGETFSDLNSYYAKVLKKKNKGLSKHSATIQLVNSKLPKCSSYYRWLYDACMNSRYTNYSVSNKKAKLARDYLRVLRNHLTK